MIPFINPVLLKIIGLTLATTFVLQPIASVQSPVNEKQFYDELGPIWINPKNLSDVELNEIYEEANDLLPEETQFPEQFVIWRGYVNKEYYQRNH